jgi:hypothetical protein
MISEGRESSASDPGRSAKNKMPQNREGTGFRGPSPDVGKATRFKAGKSGNPGGRPKRDIAAEIAQLIFEKNGDEIYRVMLKALKNGNSKVFAALADRAYGKPRQADDGDSLEVKVVVDL